MRTLMPVLLCWSLGIVGCAADAPGEGAEHDNPHTAYSLRPPPLADLAYSRGQTVYVPVYSQVNVRGGQESMSLAANVVVRNTDESHSITLTSVRYFDNRGRLLGEYLDEAQTLAPLASRNFFVAERDRGGGVGASMLIDWRATEPASEPIIEAVMVHVVGTQGVTFTSQGRVVEEHVAEGAPAEE